MKIKTNVVPFMIEKKTLTDHKHLNQDGALGAHLLDIIHLVTCICNFQEAFFFRKRRRTALHCIREKEKVPIQNPSPIRGLNMRVGYQHLTNN